MAGYDYSVSRIDMESRFGRTVPAPWNEPHRIQARTLWRFHPSFSAVFKWKTVLGRSWGFRQAYYDYLSAFEGAFTFSNPEEDRLPPFHQLDFTLLFQPAASLPGLDLRLDLINLLNRRNVIDWYLVPSDPANPSGDELEIGERTLPGFYPVFTVQIRL